MKNKPRKPILALLIVFTLVLALWPAAALADGETVHAGPGNQFVCTVINGGTALRLVSYNSTPTGIVTLPDSADTLAIGYGVLPITEIGEAAFRNCADITSVTLPSNLVMIGKNAFQNCGLYSIIFPNTLRTIGDNAFYNCSHLQSPDLFPETALPNSLQTIGSYAFYQCTSMSSITIPDSVTSIGVGAFEECYNLASAVLPDNASFTAIPERLFNECALTSLTIPDSVTSFGVYSLAGNGFSTFEIPKDVTAIDVTAFNNSINHTSFTVEPGSASFVANDGALYSADMKKLIRCPFAKTSLNVPEGVTEIGPYACDGCWHLTSLTLPGTLTTIGEYGFNLARFPSVTIPAGVTSIGWFGFQNNSKLQRAVFLTDTVTFDGDWVFGSTVFYGHEGSTAQTYASGHNIPFVLLLELSASPDSGLIYTNGRITITPNVAGGTWDFDGTLLSRDGNVFTGLKAGTAHVTYTAGWQTASVDVVIRKSQLPSTGQDLTAVYWMLAVAALSGAAALSSIVFSRKRAQ